MRGRAVGPVLIALVVALVVGAGAVVADGGGLFERLELASVDARYPLRADAAKLDDVVLVAIDERTMDQLQVNGPLPRRLHARVIDRLHRAGVRALAYDIQFSEQTTMRDDNALIMALRRARRTPTVLATAETDARGNHNVFGGDPAPLRFSGARVAHAAQLPDGDGVVRRLVRSVDRLETFPAAVIEEATGRQLAARRFAGGREWVDFAGPPDTVRAHSFVDVLRGEVPARELRGRIAVVGATAVTFHDDHDAGSSNGEEMPGPELQAHQIATLLDGVPLREAPDWLRALFVVLAAFAGVAWTLALRALRTRAVLALGAAALITLSLLALVVLAIVAAFRAGLILPAVAPLAAFGLASMLSGALMVSWQAHERARERLRETFGRFIPEQALDQVTAAAGGEGALRGVERDATVMFADLRGFTNRSEESSASAVIEFLNRYLSEMSEAILAHGGTVVSYMGDGIMAVFGAPLEQPDHADRALAATREMQGERLERFNRWLLEQGHTDPVRLSIGLHSGTVASGTVGSARRLEYAAVGDTTNVAARLEAMTRKLDVDVLLSSVTCDRLADGGGLRYVDSVAVKGLQRQVEVWTLADARAEPSGTAHERDEAHGPGVVTV